MNKFRYKTLPRHPATKIKAKNAKKTQKDLRNRIRPQSNRVDETDSKLLFHCKNCEYDVIKDIITRDYGFELTVDDNVDFDIIWHNTGLKSKDIKRLKSHQKYNHFPGMYQLANKNNLGRNLMKMNKMHPEEYNFFPKTWVLPNDFSEFLKYYKKNEGKTYIIKPAMLSQGKGIFLTQNCDDINPRQNAVIQEYIDDPFLVDNLKFDIRLYVFVTSVDPLRIYLFDEGLVRFATEEYQAPTEENMKNIYIHLTNYSLNKKNKNFVVDDENGEKGYKRPLKQFWASLKKTGIDTDVIHEEIKDIIVKTFLAVQPQLSHEYKSCISDDLDGTNCFEILGFDIMLDEKLDPILIEINHAPAFGTDSNIDFTCKSKLIRDSFRMLNMSLKRKQKVKKERNKISKNRLLNLKKEYPTMDNRETKRLVNTSRHKYEMDAKGNYELLYPILTKTGEIIPDIGDNYSVSCFSRLSTKSASVTSSMNEEFKKFQNEQSNLNDEPKPEEATKNLSEEEKLAKKYKNFAQDAFQVWDDLMNGCYRTRTRFLVSEDPELRTSKKSGLGSSSKRIDLSAKRVIRNKEVPKSNFVKTNIRNKRSTFHQPQRQKNSSCVIFGQKSISITTDLSSRRTSQGDLKSVAEGNGCLPIISEGKFKLKGREAFHQKERIPQSSKHSLPKLPKVL
ncbi:unnamed protein product [Moneuplotes crassus]|uniref:Uncharacterized protein n=2 Tax=Euplotes crassus TaxID=5936 RepID=A0AAD1U1C6_EUPCR|nr:unnamed protein product [Moneuplotes crassus]